MRKFIAVLAVWVVCMMFVGIVSAKEVLDEQFGPGGAKVELVKAKVRSNVLTLAVRYIHPWEAKSREERDKIDIIRKVELKKRKIPIKFRVKDVYYIADGKRYYVLKDKSGQWLASPVVGDYIADPGSKKGKIQPLMLDEDHPVKILWFKFPAPPEGVDGIECQVPDVTPFDVDLK